MENIFLCPPNLAALGVKRRGNGIDADLETIWATPYPVIKMYLQMCRYLGIKPFGGGTRQKQGDSWRPGFITSGYRDQLIEKNDDSPHFFALALDPVAGDVSAQIEMGRAADRCFTRVGLYPDSGMIHVDLVPVVMMVRYGKARHWVRFEGKYTYFPQLQQAEEFAKSCVR